MSKKKEFSKMPKKLREWQEREVVVQSAMIRLDSEIRLRELEIEEMEKEILEQKLHLPKRRERLVYVERT